MNDREIMLKAANEIDRLGLYKDYLCDKDNRQEKEPTGRMCVRGALLWAIYGKPEWGDNDRELRRIEVKLMEVATAEGLFDDVDDLAYWNNQPERTTEEVVNFLRLAAEREDRE